ncbi:Synaptobrevin family protein [Cryptosporidium felis]|nr:Synaptobrevin family protein [Cryptosporidium felis]
MFFKVKSARDQTPTAPASPTITPIDGVSLPESIKDEINKTLYFGFGSFLTVSIISLAVLQVNTNAICDKNLDEVNGISALLSLSMSLICSLLLFLPNQRDTLAGTFKYNELPSLKKTSIWSWFCISSFFIIPTLIAIHDISGFIKISESNACKYTAPGLFIGTSIAISFQLFIVLMFIMALFSTNLMDLIYSLPTLDIGLQNLMNFRIIEGPINYLMQKLKESMGKINELFKDNRFNAFINEFTSQLNSYYIRLKNALSNTVGGFTRSIGNAYNKINVEMENVIGLFKQTFNKLKSTSQDISEYSKQILKKSKSALTIVKEGSKGTFLKLKAQIKLHLQQD